MDGLVFANKLLQLVTEGDLNSTYKMATAIALLQTAQEQGLDASDALPTERIAETVLDLYLRQTRATGEPLRQMNREDQSSRILTAVSKSRTSGDDAAAHRAVVHLVEDALLAYPLRLLQEPTDHFIYHVPDSKKKSRRAFGRNFDGILVLRQGVLRHLQWSAPLLRPLIETAWVERVARYNAIELDEAALRRRLFGYDRRAWPRDLRSALEGLQQGCFYCGGALPRATADRSDSDLGRRTHIDHFVPWARTMNDAIENLVLADSSCNLRKSDWLPGPELVDRWIARLEQHMLDLQRLADALRWPCNPLRSVRSALVVYKPYATAGPTPCWTGSVTSVDLTPVIESLQGLHWPLANPR